MASFAVTYNANGATGGTVPVDGSSPYATGATVTVLGNTGSLVKTGVSFIGWNTAVTSGYGSGLGYQPGQTFIMGTGAIVLYAQWSVDGATRAYNPSSTDSAGNQISGLQYFGGALAGVLTAVDGFWSGPKTYWMRGWNSSTARYVTWQAPVIDSVASFAPTQVSGTITDIVWLGFTFKGL